MALTFTYAWTFVQNLDLTAGPQQDSAHAAALSDGGFVAIGAHDGHTDLDVFSSGLANTGQVNVINGSARSVAGLTNGSSVVCALAGSEVFFTVRLPSGNTTSDRVSSGNIQGSGYVTALSAASGGDFAVLTSEQVSPSIIPNTLMYYRYTADGGLLSVDPVPGVGGFLGSGFVAAGLDDGGVAIAWYEGITGNISTVVLNADGSVRRATAVFDVRDLGQPAIDITATDGGFAVVYETDEISSDEDIALARFTANGDFLDRVTLTGQATVDASPHIDRMPGGLLAVSFNYAFNGSSNFDTDLVLYDPASGAIVAERNIAGGEPLTDVTARATLAHHGEGRVAVFHTNVGDGDIDGEAVRAVRTSTGDAAADVIAGSAYNDVMNGGGGIDTADYSAASGGVTASLAVAGPQNVGGGQAADTLISIENLNGSNFADTLTGNGSANRFYGGGGIDSLRGGLGNDLYYSPDQGDAIVETAGAGFDTVETFNGSYSLAAIANVEALIYVPFFVTLDFTGTGNALDNTMRGDGGNDVVSGLAGRDAIHGGLGNDTLRGGDEAGAGDVLLAGEGGSDSIFGGLGGDRIDGGADGDLALNGDGGNDVIAGGDGNDTANGGDNDDKIYGQAGRDTLRGGLGVDTLYGGDEVGLGDVLLAGDGGNDHVQGGLGNDRIDGGSENDKLYGEAGNDTVTGGLGNDRLEGGADTDVLRGEDGDDIMLGGDGTDTLYGGIGLDRLYGNAGDDFLQGDAGNDNFYGGLGLDRFNFDPGNGSDAIFDFVNNHDTLIIDPGFGFANAAAVVAATIQTGNHARILLPGANTDIYLWDYLAPGSGNSIGNLVDDILIA